MHEIYSEFLKQHYRAPRNVGTLKSSHTAEEINELCGDEVKCYLRISQGKLADLKYEARGCLIIVATSSILSEYLKNRKVGELDKLGAKKLWQILKIKIPPARQPCALLPLQTFQKALKK